jgi:hypothetical protein
MASLLIVVRKSEAIDSLSGTIREIGAEQVQFEVDGDVLPVKRSRVDGLLYHRSGPPAKTTAACVVGDAAGSRIRAAAVSLDNGRWKLRTAGGLEIEQPVEAIARFDFSQGNLRYLGDLKPETSQWTPYLGDASTSPAAKEFYRPRSDQALDGGPLRIGGKEYKKGLAMHSRTELTYRLSEPYSKFIAVAGIDDRARPGGDLQLTIYADDRTLFEGRISGKDAPQPLELDITGANRLRIVVDFGEDLDLADHLDLCEARILK